MRRFMIWLAALIGVAYGLAWLSTAGAYFPPYPGGMAFLMAAAITAPLFPKRARR